jgi:hypothetical protein
LGFAFVFFFISLHFALALVSFCLQVGHFGSGPCGGATSKRGHGEGSGLAAELFPSERSAP